MPEPFNPSLPIYLQLCERIKNKIIRGSLVPGSRLPSVRELAIDSGVNPNTVQRAYRELEESGVTVKKRGQGTFVTEDPEILEQMRRALLCRHINHFVRQMRDIGCTEAEIVKSLNDYFKQNEGGENQA